MEIKDMGDGERKSILSNVFTTSKAPMFQNMERRSNKCYNQDKVSQLKQWTLWILRVPKVFFLRVPKATKYIRIDSKRPYSSKQGESEACAIFTPNTESPFITFWGTVWMRQQFQL